MADKEIMHIDMDAFYAAVEQRDNPALQGRPVIIGGSDPTRRGVVSAASYEAREFGVRSAMPLREAYRRCPQGAYLPVNMGKYQQVSTEIFNIYLNYTPLVETLALDEAFLDVSGSRRLFGCAEHIGMAIKQRIHREIGLVASVGISYNKYLAKLASDLEKPDGFVVINQENFHRIVHQLPLKRLWGVGAKTEERLKAFGFRTIGDVAASSPLLLKQQFGVLGEHIYLLSNGVDKRPVIPDHEAKSVGRETTFAQDVSNQETLMGVMMQLVEDVCYRLRVSELYGRCITVKVRDENFDTHTRQMTLTSGTNLENEVYQAAKELFYALHKGQLVRLVGVSVSRLSTGKDEQLGLFAANNDKHEAIAEASDKLRQKYGRPLVIRVRGVKRKED